VVAVRRPELLLDRWQALAEMLACDNAFSKMIATHVIALLALADDSGRLAAALDVFYDNLADKVSVAGHVLQVSPALAAARPELRGRITRKVLGLPAVARPDRVGLLRGYAIEALDAYLDPAERTPEARAFIEAGLIDDSPKTRKVAAEVLALWREE
jgi:hypothetical protein